MDVIGAQTPTLRQLTVLLQLFGQMSTDSDEYLETIFFARG